MGNLSKIYFQDEDFIRRNSLQCNLFIQVAERVCRILVVDEEETIQLIEEQETELFLNKDWRFVNLKFAKTFITTLPESFIFIPEEFENTDQESTIAPFLDSDSPILKSKIKNTPINTYFTVNERVVDLQKLVSESKVIPSSNVLIHQTLSIAKENEEVVGINFYKDDFEFVYIKDKQFIFYNRFPKANADDFNYYLLSTFEYFGIQAAHAQFYLAGDIDHLEETVISSQSAPNEVDSPLVIPSSPLKTAYSDENYARLSKYSSHILFLADLNKGKTSPFLECNGNQFLLLSELSKCVS